MNLEPGESLIRDGVPVVFDDAYFMRAALRCARQAAAAGEVPVGAVAVADGRILARAWNQVEQLKDATAHAEVLVIGAVSSVIQDWRLDQVDIYVTKAIISARIARSRWHAVRVATPLSRVWCSRPKRRWKAARKN